MTTVSQELRDELCAGLTCHYCPARATTWDHVIPRSKGGADGRRNLIPACKPCNVAKSDDMPTCSCRHCRRAVQWWRHRLTVLSAAPPEGFVRLRRWLQVCNAA